VPKGRSCRTQVRAARRHRVFVAAVAVLCLLGAACTHGGPGVETPASVDLQAATPAPTVSGPLRTEGTRIIGPNGKTVRLIGVNLQGMQFTNDQGSDQPDECGRAWRIPPPDAAKNIRDWGFNHVRLTFAWGNVEPEPPTRNADGTYTHHWNEEYLKALDSVIESVSAQKLAIALDPAQFQWSSAFKESGPSGDRVTCEGYGMPAWLNPNAPNETIDQARCDFVANRPEPGVPIKPWDGLAAVWQLIGERYGDNPNVVAADTINEPYFVQPTCQGADFQGMFETLGRAIRDKVPRWVLMFEYSPRTNQAFNITSPPPFDNQIYEIHLYAPTWDVARQIMELSWNQSKSWNMPMYLGEFSAFWATSPRGGTADWPQATRDLLDYMKQRDISWAVFGYAGGLSLLERNGQPKADVIKALQEGI
jgi:cellulase (glycosyl hydrolase family 5)